MGGYVHLAQLCPNPRSSTRSCIGEMNGPSGYSPHHESDNHLFIGKLRILASIEYEEIFDKNVWVVNIAATELLSELPPSPLCRRVKESRRNCWNRRKVRIATPRSRQVDQMLTRGPGSAQASLRSGNWIARLFGRMLHFIY